MKIISIEFSDETKRLVEEIFTGEDFPVFFKGHTEDYVYWLLQHMAQQCKEDKSPEFEKVWHSLAVNAHSRIKYGIELSQPSPSRDDD